MPGESQIPRPGIFRQWAGVHPRMVDIVLAAIYFIFSAALILELVRFESNELTIQDLTNFVYLIALTGVNIAALLVWRRSRPLWFFAVALITQVPSGLLLAGSGANSLMVLIALYAVATRVNTRTAWLGFGAIIFVSTGLLFTEPWTADMLAYEIFALFLSNLAITLIFVHFANRARYVEALVERGELLAAKRDQQAQLAVAEERTRIAREMHDVVAHSLAVMVTLSDGAVAVVEKDPICAKRAMERVSETGRTSVSDMRRMLGLLLSNLPATLPDQNKADESGVWHPQPDQTDLIALVSSFQAAGLPVTLTLHGELPTDANLGLAVYRIIQESLTNVLRYAQTTTSVRVVVARPKPTLLEISVTNSGTMQYDSTAAKKAWDGAGQGIIGMRERVAAFGGTLEAGPRPDGGWQVHAVLLTEGEKG